MSLNYDYPCNAGGVNGDGTPSRQYQCGTPASLLFFDAGHALCSRNCSLRGDFFMNEIDRVTIALRQRISESLPQTLWGKRVLLTSFGVRRVLRESWLRNYLDDTRWKPKPLVPRFELVYNPAMSLTVLHHVEWGAAAKDSPGKESWSTSIREGGLKFPPFCARCGSPVERYDVVELQLVKRKLPAEVTEPLKKNKEIAELAIDAVQTDRHWFPIPFCAQHGLQSRAVDFGEANGRFIFRFTNKEFGMLVGSINQLEGRWMTIPLLLARQMVVVFVFVGLIMALIGGISTARIFQSGKFWLPVPLSLLLLIGGSLIEGVSLYFWRKQSEAIEQKPRKIQKKPDGQAAPRTQPPTAQS